MKKIYVVIPNWNGADMISECIRSLEVQSMKPEIIVVNNGSTDSSSELIKEKHSETILLEFKDNAGFAGGVNRGIRYALDHAATYVLLFNNDAVAHKDWVKLMVQEADAYPRAGIVGCSLLRSNKTHIDSTGECYSVWGLPFPRGRNQKDERQYDSDTEVFGASGGASLYRAEMLKQIGLFDEDFFAYYEDVDISFRAQMAGWKIRYQPKAKAYHDVGGTSSKMGDFARYHSAKNFLLLYARNMPTRLYFKYCILFTLQFGRMALSSIARRKFGVFMKGSWAALKLHRKTVEVRRLNLSRQTVPTIYIDSILTHSRPPRIPKL